MRTTGATGPTLAPPARDVPRNGLPEVPGYAYRARAYPWAVLALRRAESIYGRPADDGDGQEPGTDAA